MKKTIEEIRAYKLANYHKNKHKNKEQRAAARRTYKEANKEHIRETAKQCADKHKLDKTSYYYKNKQKVIDYQREYRRANPEKSAARQIRRRADPFYKFKDNLRTRVRNSINTKFSKKTKAFTILGCSYEEFRSYIESKWEPWMNWSNHGNANGIPSSLNQSWDLDHIVPMSTAKTEEEAIALNHYTNLQPLCSYTNRHIKPFPSCN